MTVALAFEYPDRDVVTVTVAVAPALNPVTVSGNVAPDGVPAVTDPELTEGVQVSLAS